jgi:hypothetical protein
MNSPAIMQRFRKVPPSQKPRSVGGIAVDASGYQQVPAPFTKRSSTYQTPPVGVGIILAIRKTIAAAIFIAASTSSLFAGKAREQATVVDNVATQL